MDDGLIDAYEFDCEKDKLAPKELLGLKIAHRFEDAWYNGGVVLRKVTMSIKPEDNGKWAVKWPDSRKEFYHDLFIEDHGIKKIWVSFCEGPLPKESES